MREMRPAGRIIGADRIAVLAARTIAPELVRLRPPQGAVGGSPDAARLEAVQRRLAGALDAQRGLDQKAESV
jgi:hypothetical protein